MNSNGVQSVRVRYRKIQCGAASAAQSAFLDVFTVQYGGATKDNLGPTCLYHRKGAETNDTAD